MGQISFTPEQELVIEAFKKEPILLKNFYLTGGTALSIFYLNHRQSEDLDFFSEKRFEPREVIDLVHQWGSVYRFEVQLKQIEDVLIFDFRFKGGGRAKVDFNYYPYKRLKESNPINGLSVDSRVDIAVNKLLLTNQRTDIKDFVDLYFLKDSPTVWELMEGVKRKFNFELDPILVAADFLKVEEFDFLPKMILPLSLLELKAYFKSQANNLSKSFTA